MPDSELQHNLFPKHEVSSMKAERWIGRVESIPDRERMGRYKYLAMVVLSGDTARVGWCSDELYDTVHMAETKAGLKALAMNARPPGF